MDVRDLVVHAAFLRRLAGSLLADDHLAQDATQEALAAALRRHDVRNLRAWLAGVTRNVSLRMVRAAAGRRRAEQAAARPEALPSAEALAANAEAQHRVAEAVLQLDEPYRSTVLLRFFHQLTPSEIARRRGEPVATVKTRLRRALGALRTRLDETHGGDRRAWSAALLPLVTRRPLAGTVLGGLTLMKTKILIAAAVVALLATLFSLRRSRDGTTPSSLSRPASRSAAAAQEASPSAGTSEQAGKAGPDDEPRLESVAAAERQRYREWRRLAPMLAASRRSLREVTALVAEIGDVEEEAPPLGDAATAAYLQDLIRDYRSRPPGAGRLDLLRRIMEAQAKYLESTHDASFLSFLEEVIRGSEVEDERELAVPDGDERTLDLLLRLADHSDPAVRAAAIRSISASEAPRAVDAVVRALNDEASAVRWTAAIELEYTVADPARVPALLDRIRLEAHPLAADSMVRAVLALDPEDGVRRVENAVRDAPAVVRGAVLSALKSPEPEESIAGPVKAAEATEARPDGETAAYLRRLVQEYRSLPQGRERLAVVEKLAQAHAGYLERSDDASFLPILADIARGSPDVDERVAVVRSFARARDRRVVDLVVELKGSSEPSVRGSVASALAWVQGAEAARARQELLDLLSDRAPSVRIAVASLLSVGDRENAVRLLACLREETDEFAAYAMIEAILRLDPAGGRARIDAAASAAPAAKPVIEAALRLREQHK